VPRPGEEARLLAAAGSHLRDLIVAALETGCRLGELLSLQWSRVRWLQNELFLPGAKTKSGADRAIPISAALRAVLTRRQQDPDGWAFPPAAFVFGNEVGERVASIKTAWRGACERAKIDGLNFHDLRHEAGSRKLEAGWPLHAVSVWLAHADVATTARYLNIRRMQIHELNERPTLTIVKRG
jgi:integrase